MFIDRLDEFEQILENLCEKLPCGILNNLNGGIIIEEEVMYHPQSKNGDLLCMGAYKRDILGNSIIMYYGSFMQVYWDLPHDEFKEKIRHTLYHEITHHIEFQSGDHELEIEDQKELGQIIKNRTNFS